MAALSLGFFKQRLSRQRQWGQILQGPPERGLWSWEGAHLFSLINDPGLVDHAPPATRG